MPFLRPILVIGLMATLSTCGGNESTSGASSLPSAVFKARDIIRPYYPEAAKHPVKISNKYPDWWGWYDGGTIYLTDLWIADFNKMPIWTATVIVHEYNHAVGANEKAAYNAQVVAYNRISK